MAENNNQGIDINQVLAALTTAVINLQTEVNSLKSSGVEVKKSGRGGRHTPIHVLDTKTGKVYRTQAEAGIAVAPEYGLTVHNFVWYELVKGTKNNPAKCPNRFQTIDEVRYLELKARQDKPIEPVKVPAGTTQGTQKVQGRK